MITIQSTADGRRWEVRVDGEVKYVGSLYQVCHCAYSATFRSQS